MVFVWLQEKGANKNNRTKEHGWHQNKDYVGGATSWSSNWTSTVKNAIEIDSFTFLGQLLAALFITPSLSAFFHIDGFR